jgi:NADH-quinone oxidoreductase subunit J
MPSLLFWIFVVLMLAFGVGVVVNRNPVASALSLVVSFMCLAALFIGLDAFLIGVLQVLVYAGAVMVLFLFIIMLLDLKAEERRKLNYVTTAGGLVVAFGFVAQLWAVLRGFPEGNQRFPALSGTLPSGQPLDDVREIGMAIFTSYNLPLQIVGVLILVATIGVVVLSKRELR